MMEPDRTKVVAVLAAARPEVDHEITSPDTAFARDMYDQIVSERRSAAQSLLPRRRVLVTAVTTAAVVALGVVTVVDDRGGTGGRTGERAAPRLVELSPADVQRVASTTSTELSKTGRAEISFSLDRGRQNEQTGSGTVSFAGDDLEMVLRFDGRDGRPGFEATNRTVDGRFYLLDGPPGAKRWYRDDNATGTRGSELFSIDPRTLVGAVRSEADFVVVGTENDGGSRLRRLRASNVASFPALNLSFGPIDPATIETFEVWVDDDDVVRRLRLSAAWTEEQPERMTKVVGPDGEARTVVEPGTRTVRHSAVYAVRFHAIGEPFEILAPNDAIPVAGQG